MSEDPAGRTTRRSGQTGRVDADATQRLGADTQPPELGYAAATNVGLVRLTNQDRFLVEPPLFVLADGMGGQAAGEVAAQIVVDALSAASARGQVRDAVTLGAAITAANRRVREQARTEVELGGMGTTCSAIVILGTAGYLVHIGDSRAYLLRQGSLQALTEDHTAVGQLVRDGILTEDDAAVHPQRHVLSRAIGAADDVHLDMRELSFESGDRVMLCSDGLSGLVASSEIERILATDTSPAAAAASLVEAALAQGGHDNVTVVVIDPMDVQPVDLGSGAAAAEAPATRSRSSRRRTLAAALVVLGLAVALVVAWTGLGRVDGPSTPTPAPTAPASAPGAAPTPIVGTAPVSTASGPPPVPSQGGSTPSLPSESPSRTPTAPVQSPAAPSASPTD